MALPLLRKAWREDLTESEATTLLTDSMRVLFYRDTRAGSKSALPHASHAPQTQRERARCHRART